MKYTILIMPESKGLKDVQPVKTVDTKGMICPYPLIKTREAIKDAKAGEVVVIVTDNPPSAMETIPRLCDTRNYEYERVEISPGVWNMCIRKKGELKPS